MIYHLTSRDAWEAAIEAGVYTAPSLEGQGFIHLSATLEQTQRVANAIHAGQPNMVVLVVDPSRLQSQLSHEPPDPNVNAQHGDDELFPHLYGPLELAAVVQVIPYACQTDGLFGLLFPGKRGGFYVDAGAHHPARYSNTHFFYEYRDWRGINVDADPKHIEAFRKYRPEDVNIAAFLSDKSDESVSFKHFKGGLGSTGVEVERISASRRHRIESEEELTTVLLEDILDEFAKGRDIDLLDVDVEGFDLRVLKSLDWTKREISVVCVEDHAFQRDAPSSILEFMTSKGYRRLSHCYDTSIYASKTFVDSR